MLLLLVLLFFHLLVMEKGVFAVTVSDAEKARAQRWIAAKFQATPEVMPNRAHLVLDLKGTLLKNMATTKVYHTEVGALPFKIAGQSQSMHRSARTCLAA